MKIQIISAELMAAIVAEMAAKGRSKTADRLLEKVKVSAAVREGKTVVSFRTVDYEE